MPKAERSLRELFYEIRRVTKSREILTEKRIRRLYKGVMQDLNGFLADAYVKYSDDEGRLTLAGLERKASYARFLEEVATRADALSPGLQREMLSLADDVYTRCWRSMTDAVQNAADLKPYRDILGDNLVRPETMRQAVKNNISKLTLPPLLERNRQDVIYQIRQVLGIGLMNGDRYDTMAKRITERLDVSYSKAVLTARTESHRNQEAGMLDCAKEISRGVEGSGLIYTATWRAMLDERVRPNHRYHTKAGWKTVRRGKADHQKMEGKIIRVGDRFDLGDGVYAEAPGSSGVAAHDCNCRCYLEYALMTPEEFVAAGGKVESDLAQKKLVPDDQGAVNTVPSDNAPSESVLPEQGDAAQNVASTPKEAPAQKETSTPEKISIVTEEYSQRKGNPDGHYIIPEGYDLSKHKDECTMAEWISRTFGGNIRVLTEVSGQKNPDYEWDGKFWELKTVSTAKAVDSALRKAGKQIRENPGGVILDFTGPKEDLPAVLEAVKDRVKRWNVSGVVDTIITSEGKTIFVVRIQK